MEHTVLLLIAAGGAVFGVLAIADVFLAIRARARDKNGVQRQDQPPQAPVYGARPESVRRSGKKSGPRDEARVQQALIVELHRTRSILLGWLSVLEAFALGDAWRATALRAELGDINTCDITLVGDANVIATYQVMVDTLRNQAGRGLPPEVASDMASIRVRLLTALAEQERRLDHGEKPVIAEPLVHLDLWGPPRPITEVMVRSSSPTSQPLLGDSSTSSPASPALRAAEPPLVVRPVTVGLPAPSAASRETKPSISAASINPPSPLPALMPGGPAPAASKPPIARRATPKPTGTQPRTTKAPARAAAPRAVPKDASPPPVKAATRPATKSTASASTRPAAVVEAAPAKPARRTAAAPTPVLLPVPAAVAAPRAVRTVPKPASMGTPSAAPVALTRPTPVPAARPTPIGASKPTAAGPRPAARATLRSLSQLASSPGGKAAARPTSKRITP